MATRKTKTAKASARRTRSRKASAGSRPKSKAGKKPARAATRGKAPARAKAKASSRTAPASKGKGSAPTARPPAAARGGSAAEGSKPAPSRPAGRKSSKSSRRATLLRRGPNGEILAPGDLLLPGGIQRAEEIIYLFRGCAAAERPVGEDAVAEVFARRPTPEAPGERDELLRTLGWANERFERGSIEPVVPPRSNLRRSFQGVVERARHRRREIGAFLRGLDIGHTETSHMDAHGEASLQSLMEWAARLENLTEADEPTQADYNQFHRGLDQLENTTEALIIDVEQTLRRLRDRLRS
jgi:hypothetical protein